MQPEFTVDATVVTLAALAVLLILTIVAGLKIVPQAQAWVITRLGRFHRVLRAGPSVIVPFLDRVHQRVPINDQVIPDLRLDVVSRDNVVFAIEVAVFYRIIEPEKAVFRVNDVDAAVQALVKSLVRAEIGKAELDDVQQDRQSISNALRVVLEEASSDYGVKISRAEIVDVQLNETTQRAMQEMLEAERQRRAAVTRAEGEKRAVELAADAALYQAEKEAEAKRVTADATAYANGVIAEAIGAHGDKAAAFQIAERQIGAVQKLAEAPNSRLILLPGAVADGFTTAAAILAGDLERPGAPPRPWSRPDTTP